MSRASSGFMWCSVVDIWCYAICGRHRFVDDAGTRGAIVAAALAYGSCTERLVMSRPSLVSVGFCLAFCGGGIVVVRCIHALLQCVFV